VEIQLLLILLFFDEKTENSSDSATFPWNATVFQLQNTAIFNYRTPSPTASSCLLSPTHIVLPSQHRLILSTVAARKTIEEKSNEFNDNGGRMG
jgi:hypothetical protein